MVLCPAARLRSWGALRVRQAPRKCAAVQSLADVFALPLGRCPHFSPKAMSAKPFALATLSLSARKPTFYVHCLCDLREQVGAISFVVGSQNAGQGSSQFTQSQSRAKARCGRPMSFSVASAPRSTMRVRANVRTTRECKGRSASCGNRGLDSGVGRLLDIWPRSAARGRRRFSRSCAAATAHRCSPWSTATPPLPASCHRS